MRKKNLYKNIKNNETFKISRSKIESYIKCERCFYIDRVEGISVPSGPPFTLNSAVDNLLKNEFDVLRNSNKKHEIIKRYNIDATPAKHKLLDKWRNNFQGIQVELNEFNFLVFGAIDDLWINSKDEYIVVDYKATSKKDEIIELNSKWHDAYKRQMEIYQWLLRKNGLKVSNKGYILYCNGSANKNSFANKLEFRTTLHEHSGDDSWVYNTIKKMYNCLNGKLPEENYLCELCNYNIDIINFINKKKIKDLNH